MGRTRFARCGFEGSPRGTQRKAVLAVALGLAWAGTASAHGGIPRATQILVEPGNPNDIVVRSDYWGLFRTTDGAKTWNYYCSEAWGASSLDSSRSSTLLLGGGRLLVASSSEGLAISDDPCVWHVSGSFSLQQSVQGFTPYGSDLIAVSDFASDGGVESALLRSSDKGETWTRFGGALPRGFAGEGVAVAPSDAKRIYVAGQTRYGAFDLAVSTDGGASFALHPVPLSLDPNTLWTLRVRLVHPTKPDVVVIWADGGDLTDDVQDQLWASSDAGVHWTQLFVGSGDLPGFALSPDHTTVLVGAPGTASSTGLYGIQSASLDDAIATGQSAFTTIYDQPVWGLDWTSNGLYAGMNEFTPNDVPPRSTLSVSHDGGHTFSKIMDLCQVQFPACPSSTTEQICVTPTLSFSVGNGGFDYDLLEGPLCTATSGSDAGTNPSGDASSTPSKSSPGLSGIHDSDGVGAASSDHLSIHACSVGTVPTRGDGAGLFSGLFALLVSSLRIARRRSLAADRLERRARLRGSARISKRAPGINIARISEPGGSIMATQVPPVSAIRTETRRPTLEVDEKTSLDARRAVRRLVEELRAGWDRHDAETTNRHFAEDILWGSPFGASVRGYAPLHAIHTKLKAKGMGGRSSHFEVESVLVPTPDVAVAQIRRKAFAAPGERATATDDAKGFSEMALYVLVRRGDDWWVAAGQNTPIKPDAHAPKHDE